MIVPPPALSQLHPKISKGDYDAGGVLKLKDATKPFPTGRPVGVLRWTFSGQGETALPLTINCWPEDEGGEINVNIEYQLQRPVSLSDVQIVIPLGTSAAPSIASIDGAHKHNAREENMVWSLELIDESNKTGALEFNIRSRDTDAFFPIQVSFVSQDVYCTAQVAGVSHIESGAPITHSLTKSLMVDNFRIE